MVKQMLIEKVCFSKLGTVNISCLTIGSPIQELKGLPTTRSNVPKSTG